MRADDPQWGCIDPDCNEHPATGGGPVFRLSSKSETWSGACREHWSKYSDHCSNPQNLHVSPHRRCILR